MVCKDGFNEIEKIF